MGMILDEQNHAIDCQYYHKRKCSIRGKEFACKNCSDHKSRFNLDGLLARYSTVDDFPDFIVLTEKE